MSTLSIVIVSYNTHADLRTCLIALEACTPRPEIIVVDNASIDGSGDMVRLEFPGVQLLALSENRWFSGGNNAGIRAARGDYVLLLNPDTIPNSAALNAMVSFLDEHPDYDGVTCRLRYPDGRIQRTCSQRSTFAYLVRAHILGTGVSNHWYNGWQRDTDRDVSVVPGSCLMTRREGFRLDERFKLYFVEDDLPGRYRFLAGVSIVHREKSSTRNWQATRVYFADMLAFTHKHYGAACMVLLWLISRPLYWGMWVKHTIRT